MNNTVRIIAADDHPIFREGITKILERENTFRIVASVGSGDEAIEKIRTLLPDIAILDISMPGLSGLAIAKIIKEEELPVNPIILTMYQEEEYLEEALELGITGYLLKDATLTEIVACIKTVAGGGYYISNELTRHLFEKRLKKTPKDEAIALIAKLTPTEKLILKQLSLNKTSAQIAKELFVSNRTVQNHRLNIGQKLHLHGYNTLLQFALEHKDIV